MQQDAASGAESRDRHCKGQLNLLHHVSEISRSLKISHEPVCSYFNCDDTGCNMNMRKAQEFGYTFL